VLLLLLLLRKAPAIKSCARDKVKIPQHSTVTVIARFNDTLGDMPKVSLNRNVVNSNDITGAVACSLSLNRKVPLLGRI
jgi:hypothetical protein